MSKNKSPELNTDQYQHVKYLGKGSFGVCNLMRDKVTAELVAVKLLDRGPRITEGTRREVASLRRLRHPNVVACKQVFLTPDYLCIAMEYVPGGELYAHVTKSDLRRLPEDKARYFFRQLVAGMEYCHTLGVWHRDLKLENVLLDGSNPPRIKICDFGLSKGSQDSLPKSRVGTSYYMAPEVLTSSATRRYDGKAADVWALGVMLYTLVAGTYPFADYADMLNKDKVFERIKALHINNPTWVNLSKECADLLNQIFVKADRRITLQQIIAHPWVTQPLPAVYQQALDADSAAATQLAATAAGAWQSDEEVQELVTLAQQVSAPDVGTEDWMQDAVDRAMDQSCEDSFGRYLCMGR